MPIIETPCPVHRVTDGPQHHFFGYYEKTPWSADGRYLLALQADPMTRLPEADDAAIVGLIDRAEGDRWHPLVETTAWNWQQGAMLQWVESAPDRQIIFNVRRTDGYGAVVLDIKSGEQRLLPRPIYAVGANGRDAVTLNYTRLRWTRPTCGYAERHPQRLDNAPDDDGIFYLNVQNGASHLIVSLAQLAAFEPLDSMAAAPHWVNHLLLNPSGTRLAFLHRWRPPGQSGFLTRFFTVNLDGTDLALLEDAPYTSHFDWRDDQHLLSWGEHAGKRRYFIYRDRSAHVSTVGVDVLTENGHCTYSPDGHWVLTDTYPDAAHSERTLILYHPASNTRVDVGRFYSPPAIMGDIRCDLHPRWSRDGQQVCIDSYHEGERQVYVVDGSDIIG